MNEPRMSEVFQLPLQAQHGRLENRSRTLVASLYAGIGGTSITSEMKRCAIKGDAIAHAVNTHDARTDALRACVEAMRSIASALGSAEWGTPEHGAELFHEVITEHHGPLAAALDKARKALEATQ